jgi:nitroreductase
MIDDLIRQTRSTRRFVQSEPVSLETLRALVNLARLSPSASNKQPLKYILCHTPEQNAVIFKHVGWAGYLSDWPGPAEGERPAAYIVILSDCHVSEAIDCDHGIAAQSILLGARERGLGGCILGSIKRAPLRSALKLDVQYRVMLVIALGKPAEEIVLEEVGPDGDIKYWRDTDGVHHVPKRPLDELIIQV